MDKRFLAILAALVVIFVGIFAFSQHSGNKKSSGASSAATNHVEGQGQAGVTLVEYGDYQCPICFAYYQPLKLVVAQFSSQIYFQFRNLPLVSAHKNAFAGARAAEAAGLQNKYWQMHDQLYETQLSWAGAADPLPFFKGYAAGLGLNVDQFAADYASNQVNDAINADLAAFNDTRQPLQTPTFFLDGKLLKNSDLSDPKTGTPQVDKFAAVLNAEIAAKAKH